MSEENKKDERLDALFTAYLEEGDAPAQRVTEPAREHLRRRAVRVKAAQAELAAEGGTGEVRAGRRATATPLILSALALLLIAAFFLLWFLLRDNADPFLTAGDARVSRPQLTETTLPYGGQEFLPFVEGEEIAVYKEYALSEDVGSCRRGEVVLYYLEYTEGEGAQARLFVAANGIEFDELDGYRGLKERREHANATYYVGSGTENESTDIYFLHDLYAYHLTVRTNSGAQIETILARIDGNL